MKAIVTVVIEDLPSGKGKSKAKGIDIFGRMSTDVSSKHKSFLLNIDDGMGEYPYLTTRFIEQHFPEWLNSALAKDHQPSRCIRISRIEYIGKEKP